ncbi:MAG TPA: selenocysteine-specific translation elongation factor [Symbiobacteriaceae bacterium]|nr:selenocysteine-specific translation elongation factor [Symbiobacteriaceae bacterium]
MEHLIIGTAGHVDHGKSALVRALTGVETDRFPEERSRGISIDIGFAHFALPSGRRAAIVDVPGHERFIKNMLAGATGVDLVLLVVAADEGVMPQTREHLAILQLLGLKKGLIVLTKADLVDGEMLELVELDVAEAVTGTFLAGAPVLAVSSVTGQGLPELTALLDQLLTETEAKDVTAFVRLPIDRVFTRQGFGTVVTGTLVGGVIRESDSLEVLPTAKPVRVRGLQVHGAKVDRAEAGQRVAINLAGIDRDEVQRGDVLAATGALRPTNSFAGRLTLVADGPTELKHGTRVHLHTGTTEVLARVLLLEGDALSAGREAFVQVKTEQAIVVGRGDRFIIRSYSPVHTIGGGGVVEPHAAYKKSQADAALSELQAKESGGLASVIEQGLLGAGIQPMSLGELAKRTGVPVEALTVELEGLTTVTTLEGGLLLHRRSWAQFIAKAQVELEAHAKQYPLRLGLPKEELRRRLGLGAKEMGALLERAVATAELGLVQDRVTLPGRRPQPNSGQAKIVEAVRKLVTESGFQPPSGDELRAAVTGRDLDEVLLYLSEGGEIVRIGEFFMAAGALNQVADRTRAHLKAEGRLTVAAFRDLLQTSRKYALPLLEWLDEAKITRRAGEERVLGPNA